MRYTQRDLENVKLRADARWSDFLERFNKNYNKPDAELNEGLTFKALSPEEKEAFKKADPQAYAAAVKKYGGV